MLLPANALKEVGLFDESYFLYFEDADLSIEVLCSKGTYIRTLIEDIG